MWKELVTGCSAIPADNPRRTTMSRIPTPTAMSDDPAASQPLLESVNMLISDSPAALGGYVGLSGALGKGTLPAATRERIALAVAEISGCDDCLSAHTY